MERYTTLFRLPINLYTVGSPVLIAAGALLKDNQTGKVLAQLKLQNLTDKIIKAVKCGIKAFDISGNEITGIEEVQYLDLSIPLGSTFGTQTAIFLPEPITRSFSACCTSVIFNDRDHTVWTSDQNAVWEPLPKQQNLETLLGNTGLVQQYQRDTSQKSCFIPIEHDDLWLCSCGAANKAGKFQCHSCGITKNKIFSSLDSEALKKEKEEFEKEEAEKSAIQEQESKVQEDKRRKIAIIISAVVLGIAVISILIFQVFLPMQKYNTAISLMDEGNYDEAIVIFEELNDTERVEECKRLQEEFIQQEQYQLALGTLNNAKNDSEYLSAINTFEELGDYKDSPSLLKSANYQYADYLVKQKDFKYAITIFESLGNYKDSKSRIEEVKQYQIDAIHQLLESGDYEGAENAYLALDNYETSPLSKDDFIITENGSNKSIDVFENLNSEDQFLAWYYYDPSIDKDKENIVQTTRGIQLGDTDIEVKLAYGDSYDYDSVESRNNFRDFIADTDSTAAKAMAENCEYYYCYTFEKNYKIYFCFDTNNEVTFLFFSYNYSLENRSTPVIGYWR